MSDQATKHPVTLSLCSGDFYNAVARGIEDKILYCPHDHHIEVSSVSLTTGEWQIIAQIVKDESE